MNYICPVCMSKITKEEYENKECKFCESFINIDEKLNDVYLETVNNLHCAIESDDYSNIINYSEKVLEIVPDCYFSKYAFAYANYCLNNEKPLLEFLKNVHIDINEETFKNVLLHIKKYLCVNKENIHDNIDKSNIEKYRKELIRPIEEYIANQNVDNLVFYLYSFYSSIRADDEEGTEFTNVIVVYPNQCESIAFQIRSSLTEMGRKCYLEDIDKPSPNGYYARMFGLINKTEYVLFLNLENKLSLRMRGLARLSYFLNVPAYLIKNNDTLDDVPFSQKGTAKDIAKFVNMIIDSTSLNDD